MDPTLSLFSSRLEEDIPLLEDLDHFRERCERWRAEGLASLRLVATDETPRDERWSECNDIDTRALIVKALCRNDLASAADTHLEFLRRATVDDVLTPVVQVARRKLHFKKSPTHILDCALALTALSSAPSEVFSASTMFFYYVVVRELYETAPKKWTVGSARAGFGGAPSALATSELVRGVLSFRRMLLRTGAYIDSLADLQGKNTVPMTQWEAQDSTRRALALSTTLARRAFNLAFPLSREAAMPLRFDNESIAQFEKEIFTKLTKSLKSSVRTFQMALDEVNAFRERERTAADGDLQKRYRLDRSESAHAVAKRALEDALKRATAALQGYTSRPHGDFGKKLRDLARAFEASAAESRRIIDPSIEYLSAVLDREIAAASADSAPGGFEAWEMATAAAGLGAADGNWDDERLERAARYLSEVLGPDGFVISKPYFVTRGSYFQLPQAVILGAYAQLLEHVENVDLSTVALRRMVSSFEMTRREPADGRSSWRWTYADDAKEHSVYQTAIATLALDRICRMLDARINNRVLRHFTHRNPSELSADLRLNTLFYPDYGLSELRKEGEEARLPIAIALERMRAHLAGTKLQEPYEERFYSAVFHGPPGTGKTTLLEALARSAEVTLVEVTPSEIVVEGTDKLEARARSVLRALSLLTNVVISFDEFDPVLRKREGQDDTPPTIFAFLTPSMLPKLKKLYEAAKKRRIAYALITNVIGALDAAAIRAGRFDANIGVYPPDVVSRFGRLWNEASAYRRETESALTDIVLNPRFERIITESSGASMQHVGKPGWFTLPGTKEPAKRGTIFAYLFSENGNAEFPSFRTVEAWSDDKLSEDEKRDMEMIRAMDRGSKEYSDLWQCVSNAFQSASTRPTPKRHRGTKGTSNRRLPKKD